MNTFVLNTRPAHQALPLRKMIERQIGMQSIELPLLKILPRRKELWQEQLPKSSPDWLIFISANAVENSIEYLKGYWPTQPLIAAIGPATKKALERHDISVDITAENYNSTSLTQHSSFQNIKNKTIIIIKGLGGRDVIQKFIQAKKANLIELNVYQRNCPPSLKNQIEKTWQSYEIDLILIYSIEALKNLILHSNSTIISKVKNATYFVISQRIRNYAIKIGINKIIIVKESIEKELNNYMKHRTLT